MIPILQRPPSPSILYLLEAVIEAQYRLFQRRRTHENNRRALFPLQLQLYTARTSGFVIVYTRVHAENHPD